MSEDTNNPVDEQQEDVTNDDQTTSTGEQEAAMRQLEIAAALYVTQGAAARAALKSGQSTPPTFIDTIDGQRAEFVFSLDDQGELILTTLMQYGYSATVKNGELLVWIEGFKPPMYGFMIHMIEGQPRPMMTHRWVRENFTNPQFVPAFTYDLLDMLARAIQHKLAATHPQLAGPRWMQRALPVAKQLDDYKGELASPALMELYSALMPQIMELSQVENIAELWTGWAVSVQTLLAEESDVAANDDVSPDTGSDDKVDTTTDTGATDTLQ